MESNSRAMWVAPAPASSAMNSAALCGAPMAPICLRSSAVMFLVDCCAHLAAASS